MTRPSPLFLAFLAVTGFYGAPISLPSWGPEPIGLDGAPGSADRPAASSLSEAYKKKCTNNERHRWDVKTLADSEAAKVDTAAKPTTIQALRALSAPHHWRRGRHAPTETQAFVVSARLMRWHRSGDRDFHLVLADLADTLLTVVAEVPDPKCVGEAAASWRPAFARLRDLVKGLPDGTPVRVTGVGFFDQDRGQDGGVPNGIELHPVLDIQVIP